MSSADLTVLRYIAEVTKGVTPDDSVRATATLTGTTNFADGETVTINGKVYTFQSTLTNVDGNVKIAATLALSLVNLKNAINRDGSGVAGTDFATATTAHTTVTCTTATATTIVIRAILYGTVGNAYGTTETCTNASWGGATMSGGSNSTLTALKQIRYTGESINFSIENTQTAEITPTRVETDLIQTGASGEGAFEYELSYGTYDDFIEAVLCGTWTSDEVENGTTLRTFTIQKHFQDMDVPQFHNYRGCAIEGWSFSGEIGKIVSGSFNIMSFGLDPVTGITSSQIPGATFPVVSTTTPMNAVTNLNNLTVNGVPYSGCISKLSVNIKNNIRAIKCIGSLTAVDMKLGTLEVTGDMEFYYNEGSTYALFVAGTEFSFSFDLEDDAGNLYTFTFDRCKFESGEVVAGGRNSDVMFSAKWRALYDGTATRVVNILRNPA